MSACYPWCILSMLPCLTLSDQFCHSVETYLDPSAYYFLVITWYHRPLADHWTQPLVKTSFWFPLQILPTIAGNIWQYIVYTECYFRLANFTQYKALSNLILADPFCTKNLIRPPPPACGQPLLSASRDVQRNVTGWVAHNQKLGCQSVDHWVFWAHFGTPGLQESRLTNCIRTSEHAVMAMGLPSTFLIKSVGIHPPTSTMLIHSLT